MSIFYRPKDGVCGDFVPLYNSEKKRFDLYYLHDYRDIKNYGEGTPWRRITTTDFIHFEEDGEMIPRGGEDEQDLFIFTGCVVHELGQWHIFYTGHNHHLTGDNDYVEAIMHAISDDAQIWTKVYEDTFYAPRGIDIEKDDWRDPFVFWNEDEQCYWMLLCTRKKEGPSRRRGATGLLTSKDLKKWDYIGSLWDPHLCWCPECPDMFKWGEWWYLVYSTSDDTEGLRTFYRMAKSPRGPWIRPDNYSIDGRAFYAGKTAWDGKNRFIFGWNPTRNNDKDNGEWQWGGNLIVHQLLQNTDGTLAVRMPETLKKCYSIANSEQDTTLLVASGHQSSTVIHIPRACMVSLDIKMDMNTAGAGLMLHCSNDKNDCYSLRLEPARSRMVLDSAPRSCEHPDIERPYHFIPEQTHHLDVILDDTMLVAYLDDCAALSARIYDHNGNGMALFCTDGEVAFTNIIVRHYTGM